MSEPQRGTSEPQHRDEPEPTSEARGKGERCQTSELDQLRWSLISERSTEATSLTYAAAVELERRLIAQQVRGLCIVTDAAARRMNMPEPKPAAA